MMTMGILGTVIAVAFLIFLVLWMWEVDKAVDRLNRQVEYLHLFKKNKDVNK